MDTVRDFLRQAPVGYRQEFERLAGVQLERQGLLARQQELAAREERLRESLGGHYCRGPRAG